MTVLIRFFILLYLMFCIPLTAQQKSTQKNIKENTFALMDVDRDFSRMSEQMGVNKAFLFYAADDAVLLRPNNPPIVGKNTMKEKFFSRSDSGFTLTWQPLYADVAKSGELGYTFGIYEFKALDKDGNTVSENGTYVSIWKKDKSGNWKFVLDTGNEGLETTKK